MKRIIVVCLSLVVALCGFGLAGCAQSDQDVIRNGITEELNKLKNMDDKTVSEIETSLPYSMKAQFNAMGLSLQDYFKAYFQGFDFQIGDIKVDGNKATVDMTLEVKSATDVAQAITAYEESLSEEQLFEIANALYGSADMPSWYGEGIIQAVSEVPNNTTETLQIPVSKSGNTWSYDEAADDILAAAVAGA